MYFLFIDHIPLNAHTTSAMQCDPTDFLKRYSQGGNLQSASPYGSPARSPSPYRGTGIHLLISSASVQRLFFS